MDLHAQLLALRPASQVTVTTLCGEKVSGLFDGTFGIDGDPAITGIQVLNDPPFGVRFIDFYEIAGVA